MNHRSLNPGVYWPFAVNQIKRNLAYKAAFLTRFIGGLMAVFVQASLWDAIWRSSGQASLRGYDRASLLTYIVMSWITRSLVNTGVEWGVAGEIRRGSIAIHLIKPINYVARLLSESAGSIAVSLITVVLPAWTMLQLFLSAAFGVPGPDLSRTALFLVSLTLGFTISFTVNFLFSLLAFWVNYFWGMAVFKNAVMRFFTGELIPLSFFPAGTGVYFALLPFAGMVATPVSVYLGTYSGNDALQAVALQAFWALILGLLARKAWKKAIHRLTVAGG